MGSTTAAHRTSPPGFVRLAGHPVRWALLTELARSDRRVNDLTDLVGQPQPLLSYHLARLRQGGLVTSRRSSHDGRATYYRLELARCGEALSALGTSLHPGLGLRPALPPSPPARRRRARVLFACTGNGARSQIAEALLRHLAGDRVGVESAGSHPKPIHPNAVRVLAERGVDHTDRRSKPLSQFDGERFDHVITLCDRVREVCPEFAPPARTVHWSIEDPSRRPGTDRSTYPVFRALADDLDTRIRYLIAVIDAAVPEEVPDHAHR